VIIEHVVPTGPVRLQTEHPAAAKPPWTPALLAPVGRGRAPGLAAAGAPGNQLEKGGCGAITKWLLEVTTT
jgi:hypothetical protein